MNLNPFIGLISMVLDLYKFVLIFWIVLSWLISFDIINRFNPVVVKVSDILFRINEPVLRRIRKYMPNLGGIDLSPIAAFLAIWFIKSLLYTYFYKF